MEKISTEATEMVTISRTEYDKLQSEANYYKKMYDFLCEQLRNSKRQQFGSKSERISDEVMEQLSLMFDEAEFIAETIGNDTEEAASVSGYTRKHKSKTVVGDVPDNVPIEVIDHKLTDTERECPVCGETMQEIGSEVRRRLVILPAEVKVIEDRYYTYACKKCDAEDISTPIVKAPVTPAVIPGSFASSEAIAYLMTEKFVMGSPLFRMEANFKRQNIALSRQTMSNWMLKATELYLEPVYALLKQQLLANDIIHADETTLQVLHEENKTASQKSYMWLYRTGKYSKNQVVLYEYNPGRSQCFPKEFLGGYKGYLHTDGYSAYHSLPGDIIVVGCLAHARRRFENALKALPKGKSAMRTACQKGVAYCTKLFNLEKKFNNYAPEQRYLERLKLAKPILDEFFVWAEKQLVLPKSGLGKALEYLLNQKQYLERYLLDGRLEISNNRAERSIKGFVIDRKNFLFANTSRGAQGSATMFSLIETAKENKLDPYKYLKFVFDTASLMDMDDTENVRKLLPENAPDTCRVTSRF